MAIKTKDEILSMIREHFAEDTSDETISFIEDVSDTFADLESKKKDGKDWEAEAKRIDEDWRKKYKERFFSGKSEDNDDDDLEEEEEKKTYRYEDLFKEE